MPLEVWEAQSFIFCPNENYIIFFYVHLSVPFFDFWGFESPAAFSISCTCILLIFNQSRFPLTRTSSSGKVWDIFYEECCYPTSNWFWLNIETLSTEHVENWRTVSSFLKDMVCWMWSRRLVWAAAFEWLWSCYVVSTETTWGRSQRVNWKISPLLLCRQIRSVVLLFLQAFLLQKEHQRTIFRWTMPVRVRVKTTHLQPAGLVQFIIFVLARWRWGF